jgi:hypothetical protein
MCRILANQISAEAPDCCEPAVPRGHTVATIGFQVAEKRKDLIFGDVIETKLRYVPSLCIGEVTEEQL